MLPNLNYSVSSYMYSCEEKAITLIIMTSRVIRPQKTTPCLLSDSVSPKEWLYHILDFRLPHTCWFCACRYIGALGARVICDNIPGLVNKQRQLCQRHPDLMQSIGEGAKEWIRECQHQFRHHRWNCSTLERDPTVFGQGMLRSESAHVLSLCVVLRISWLFKSMTLKLIILVNVSSVSKHN